MKTTSKKSGKKSKAKPRAASASASIAALKKTIAAQAQEIRQGAEQQAATSEILRVIASAPKDLQPVLDTMAENAARLCDATDAVIFRVDDGFFQPAASYGSIPVPERDQPRPVDRNYIPGRAMIDRQTIHIHDLAAEPEDDLPARHARSLGVRTILAAPLLREGKAIGTIMIRRMQVRPFSDKQTKLLETFADQAVIAIENVRLFQELSESLERQTATSEILGVIASSPTNIQPVLNVVAENAARLCDASNSGIWRSDGENYWLVASHGPVPIPGGESIRAMTRASNVARAMIDHETVHTPDMSSLDAQAEFPEPSAAAQQTGIRTVLITPLLREGVSIGAIHVRRTEVRPFSDKQIALLKTFADQAVIAIENVRLFKELQARNRDLTEALEQQTATTEVLAVIAGSPTQLQPVLDTVVANAVRLAGAQKGHIYQHDGEFLRVTANYNESPEEVSLLRELPIKPVSDSLNLRAFIEGKPFQRLDANEGDYEGPGRKVGARTVLAVPLLREGTAIGTITIWGRDVVEAFTERQVELVKTFADQAVIAIENVRLFKELEARNRDLTEALEQQTATSEILQVIASSPTDIQPVLDTVIANAVKLSGAKQGHIRRYDGEFLQFVAHYNETPETVEATR